MTVASHAQGDEERASLRDPADLVFVHSSFRTGSSWLRSKFRSNGTALVFSEIFNEVLATIDAQTAVSLSSESWNSRHPTAAPYFIEFAPLVVPDGGVAKFSADMAFDLYFPKNGEISEQEEKYVELLLETARNVRKAPVLTCTRTLGRVQSIKRKFGGVHILLTRDPFEQWCSYSEQGALGNPYFLSTNRMILKAAREAGWLNLGDENGSEDFLSTQAFYKHALLHLKLYDQAAHAADIIVNYDELERKEYREEVCQQVLAKCGLALDLSDYRPSKQFSLTQVPPARVLDEVLLPFLPLREQMHPHAASLYEMMHASLASYEKEAGELVRFSRQKLEELASANGELQQAQAELGAVGPELDATRAELQRRDAELDDTRGRLEKVLSELDAGRSALAETRSALVRTEQELRTSVDNLWRERQAAEAELRGEYGRAIEQLQQSLDMARADETATRVELAKSQERKKALERDLLRLSKKYEQLRRKDDKKDERIKALEHELLEQLSEHEQFRRKMDTERELNRQQIESVRAAEMGAREELARMSAESDNLERERARETEEYQRTKQELERDLEAHRSALMDTRAALDRAHGLIGEARQAPISRWDRIGQALGLSRTPTAIQALSGWTAVPVLPSEPLANELGAEIDNNRADGLSRMNTKNPYLRANSLSELLAWDDEDFVRCAYVTILGRQPDPEGEAHYANRIRSGHSKLEVLWQLRRSEEGGRHDPGIAGLDRALRQARRARMRLIGGVFRFFNHEEGDGARDRRARATANEIAMLRAAQGTALNELRDLSSDVRSLRNLIEAVGATTNLAGSAIFQAGSELASARRLLDPIELDAAREPEDVIDTLRAAINSSWEVVAFRSGGQSPQ